MVEVSPLQGGEVGAPPAVRDTISALANACRGWPGAKNKDAHPDVSTEMVICDQAIGRVHLPDKAFHLGIFVGFACTLTAVLLIKLLRDAFHSDLVSTFRARIAKRQGSR